jgi:hypothetical protein
MSDFDREFLQKMYLAQLKAIRAGKPELAEYFSAMVRKLKARIEASRSKGSNSRNPK